MTSDELKFSSIKDNHTHGTVGKFLQDNIDDEANLSIVSAYFTIYAYEKLKVQLNSIEHLRFLFGEPTFINSIDPAKLNKRDFKIEDDSLVVPINSKLTQKALAKECSDWINKKVEIKSMVKPNFLHGKLYLIENSNGVKESVMGSSNFTVSGLGLGGSPNIELNMVIQDRRDLEDLTHWFNELWENTDGLVEDVKEQVIKYLEQLYVENEPEFIYFKTLYHIFENYLSEQQKGGLLTERTGFFESEVWNMLYDFQKDGVKGAINKILKHNGCIIADSVGLGKTFEALAVIKYFELLNNRVLVLCPKKLSSNWTVFQAGQSNQLNPFRKDRFNYTVLYHTDLLRTSGKSDANGIELENINWGAFDLVVIDESHNFRGNPLEKTFDDGTTRMNRAKWLMEKIIKSGVKTKVLLLSATPVNNNLRDLRNQVSLITEGKNDALLETSQIKDISQTLKTAQNQFTRWADKTNKQKTVKQLLERLDSSFFKLLDELTIARSRKHILNFYDISAIGKFPVRLKPHSVYPNIDTKDRFFNYDTLNEKILAYSLSVFNPSKYVREELKPNYGIKTKAEKAKELEEKEQHKKKKSTNVSLESSPNISGFDQGDRENFLIGMMKVNYLKRLESSIESFEISMKRTIDKIEALEKEIKLFKEKKNLLESVYDPTDYKPADIDNENSSDELDAWEVGKKLKFKFNDLRLDDWLHDLKLDKDSLMDLYLRSKDIDVSRDAKLKELKTLIESKVNKPFNGNNKKVLIFTAFADTAEYLHNSLKDFVRNDLNLHLALVEGSSTKTTFGKNEFSNILTNFSPISKNRSLIKSMPQDDEINILIATDCISEGQNLQDCDYLINYDIHWNPVRIIQRFGRIDRIGSKNAEIQLVNFWPTKDLDNYINLKERVEARMALVDVTATGEDNILNTEQIEDLITEDLKYRNKQLKKLKDEVLDLEELDENISLTDFTLDDFRIELMNFIENNKERLKEAPLGLYAVVPSPSGRYVKKQELNLFSTAESEIIKPGVVFCLKQRGNTDGNEEVNPLQPYFLVYVRTDGTVRYNFTHPKQILDIYRLICTGRKNPMPELCDLFNEETKDGMDMDQYTILLNEAIKAIKTIFKKKNLGMLTDSRSASLISEDDQPNQLNKFELITWLVLK